jgi:hypothetical protein
MESKHISEMNRTEIMGTLAAAMPALDEIKQHWMAFKKCENKIKMLNQQKEEYLSSKFNTYNVNKNKSNYPDSASIESMLLYQSKIHHHESPKLIFQIGGGCIGIIISSPFTKLLENSVSQVASIICMLVFAIAGYIISVKKIYPKYIEKCGNKADKMFTTSSVEKEMAVHKQAIADIENNSIDVIEAIPKAYRTSFSAHSLYDILDNGRASNWAAATEVFENDKARNIMIENTAAAKQNSEIAIAQAEEAQQKADEAKWAAAQATSAARRAEREAQSRD